MCKIKIVTSNVIVFLNKWIFVLFLHLPDIIGLGEMNYEATRIANIHLDTVFVFSDRTFPVREWKERIVCVGMLFSGAVRKF